MASTMRLFERVKIGNVTIPNRIGLAPMGGRVGTDGSFIARNAESFARIAQGGTGLIFTGGTLATTEFEPRSNSTMENYQQISGLAHCADRVHQEGGKFFAQISPGLGRVGHKDPTNPPHAPSDVEAKFFPGVKCIPFTIEEIQRVINAVAQACAWAKTAGCDGVALHAYGGYLTDQFLTRAWNKRTDKYGGDLKGRMTFLFEMMDAVRAKCGPDFPIILKITIDHCYPENPEYRTLEEGLEMCRLLKEHGGFDALHLDRGCYEKYWFQIPTTYEEKGINLDAYKQVKAIMGDIPILGHGKLNDPAVAEKAIEDGCLDIVLLGKQLLADCDWANKVKAGKWRDINYCLGCNECLNTGFVGKHRTCAINPMSTHEVDYPLVKTADPKNILIVGGGPGGMKAALMANWMGHRATLWEKRPYLGGDLRAAGMPDFKRDMYVSMENMIHRLDEAQNVDVILNKTATAQEIIDGNWDVVILATGADTVKPRIPGLDSPIVKDAVELLREDVKLKGRVCIIGGGLVGCETALYYEHEGCQVSLVESMDDVLLTATHLFNCDQSLRHMLAESHIDINLATKVVSVDGGGVTCEKGGKTFRIDCDHVVVAVGFRSDHTLEDQLWGSVKCLKVIGNAVKPRKVWDAENEGFHAVRTLR